MSGKDEMFSEEMLDGLFMLLEEHYSFFKSPKATKREWLEALSDYTAIEVGNAYKKISTENSKCPTLADFVRICKEERERKAESERLTKKNVCYIAERAINTSYPAISLEEFYKAKRAFEKRCYEAENPARAALRLERYMRTLADETSPIAAIEGAEI